MKHNSKIVLDQDHHQHVHVDNGGVSMSIIDEGLDRGIWFKMSTEYYGYPGLNISMQIDAGGGNVSFKFLDKLEALIKAARQDLKGIDWDERYTSR